MWALKQTKTDVLLIHTVSVTEMTTRAAVSMSERTRTIVSASKETTRSAVSVSERTSSPQVLPLEGTLKTVHSSFTRAPSNVILNLAIVLWYELTLVILVYEV